MNSRPQQHSVSESMGQITRESSRHNISKQRFELETKIVCNLRFELEDLSLRYGNAGVTFNSPCSNVNVGRNFKMDSARCFLLSVAVTRSTFRECVFVCAGVRELVRRCEMCDKKGAPRTYRCLRNKSLLHFFAIMLHLSPTPRISMLRSM